MKSLFVASFFVVLFAGVSYAQIKSVKNIEFNESSYVVSDSAVFVYFLKGRDAPYKIYDFSTRAVYVYFGGGEGKQLATHNFSSLAQGEVDHIRKIGCDGAPLSGSFRRFCK